MTQIIPSVLIAVKTRRDARFGWFKLADYAATKGFDYYDWAIMLSLRHRYRENFPTMCAYIAPGGEAALKQFWGDYLADALPCRLSVRPAREDRARPKPRRAI